MATKIIAIVGRAPQLHFRIIIRYFLQVLKSTFDSFDIIGWFRKDCPSRYAHGIIGFMNKKQKAAIRKRKKKAGKQVSARMR